MSTLSPTHRIGLTESEILSVLELLQECKATIGISTECHSAYKKISTVYHKISLGAKVPDYVPNGRKRESAVSMESLGVSAEEQAQVRTGLGAFNNSAELDEDVWARIEREEREMLEKLAADGHKNVVITERRSAERLAQDEYSTDNDSIHAALMSSSNINVTDL